MRFLRKLHKWLGLIVVLQLLLWTVSGTLFSWLNHHDVSAEHSVKALQRAVLAPPVALMEPPTWTGAGEILEVRLTSVLDQWVWRVETTKGITLLNATTAEPFPLTEQLVDELATRQYNGSGKITSIVFHPTSTIETRDSAATWEARFDDDQATTFYFSADDGRLVETRNSTWRLFDFFWMLHTMDYRGRDNFNNPLVITVAFAALWLALSGLILLFKSFRRNDFAFLTAWRRKHSGVHSRI
jgi:uncharacterized iron-regulated membrane protein